MLVEARVGTSGTLIVSGEPGIGKTALLGYAGDRAAGMALLTARGTEAEAEVPFGGLLELLRPVLADVDRLPAPQADSLRAALALGPPTRLDRFTVGAATLNLLATAAEHRPLLVVVDDAHWLDRPSLAAVLFAARRLVVDPIAVLLSVRTGEAPMVDEMGLPTLDLGGVDHATAAEILAQRAGHPPPPDSAQRLFALTAGNPLALVELAGTALDLPLAAPDGPLAVQTSVERAYRGRIEALPESGRTMLLLAAAAGASDLAAVAAAGAALRLDLTELEAAERAGLVALGFGRIEFRHPLVRAAAYNAALPEQRRAAHRALAEVLTADPDGDRRAWHLASAALGPDAGAAAALQAAAERARDRGAYATAASAAERAAQLTADPARAAERRYAAAEAAWLAGDPARTIRAAEHVLAARPDALLRAEAEHLRGQATMQAGPVMDGYRILVQAADEVAARHPAKAVEMRADAAEACLYGGHPGSMLETARAAYALAAASDCGERATVRATLALGAALIYGGQGDEGARHVREATAALESSEDLRGDPQLLSSAAVGPLFLREAGAGAVLIDRAIACGRREGTRGVLPYALALAGRYATTSDRWAVGASLYEEAMRLAREAGQGLPLCLAAAGMALVAARRGDEDACREYAALALERGNRLGLEMPRSWALDALAEMELAAGRPDRAIEPLERKQAVLAAAGIADPDVSPVPDLVEACVRRGGDERAPPGFEAFAQRAVEKGQPWALARLERARGLLAGDEDFERHFAAALRLHGDTPDRFEEARTRLCHGERLRRARRRVQARAELRRSFEAFDELGAAPWAERARIELQATGETARRRDPSTLDDLTPQELQVAMLLGSGLTTREAAGRLFLSPKTVEHHLRNAYRKLGIRSRDALAAVLGAGPDAEDQGAP
ncbi:hypothetical protein DSM104329_02650 [Capillimicrobium parvum]|uniref:HTH luxR-type domain-containing protein n=2 Tax=Capillimicrobium parvum TaxID=2884022 RepID=A0A9E6XXD8_9ACTN|nr:hypothetical protein DSM104329_02650 [Capillimicrobium parvum]